MLQAKAILDELALELGVKFKESKDVGFDAPHTELEFLGITVATSPQVQAAPPTTKIIPLVEQLYTLQ